MKYKFEEPIHASIGVEKYQCTVQWRSGKFIVDEPPTNGGKDAGPDPFTLLLSSIASCTLITLRMYIDHKGWDIPEIAVNANLYQEPGKENTKKTIIDRDVVFLCEVDDEKKNRLREIADHCPISKLVKGEVEVRTFMLHETPTAKKINYAGDEITVVWKPELCQHSKRCWQQLPEVFDYKLKKWINPAGAPSEKIIEQVKKCPSGALTYFQNEQQ